MLIFNLASKEKKVSYFIIWRHFFDTFSKSEYKSFPFPTCKIHIRWQKSRESFLRFYVWTTTKCDNKSISLIKMSNKSHSPLRYFFPTCSSILQIWIEKIQFSITQQSPRLVITKSLDSAGKQKGTWVRLKKKCLIKVYFVVKITRAHHVNGLPLQQEVFGRLGCSEGSFL